MCYVEWSLETVPLEIRRDFQLASLDIHFRNEVMLGQEVICDLRADRDAGSAFLPAQADP